MKTTKYLAIVAGLALIGVAAVTQYGPLQYERTTMLLSPSNALSSNILAGTGVTLAKGSAGQLTITATATVSTSAVVLVYVTTNVFIDFSAGDYFTLTATSTVTKFIGTNFQAARTAVLLVQQDATGQRIAYWNTNDFLFPGAFPLALSTNSLGLDMITFVSSPWATNVLAVSTLLFNKQ